MPLGFVPGLDWDVFISYAHVSDAGDHWVTRFRDVLQRKISAALDCEARVWFDTGSLRGGEVIKQKIQSDLRGTALMVPVFSPGYLRSTFCSVHELRWFAGQDGKEFVPIVKIPPEQGQMLPYQHVKHIAFYREAEGGVEIFNPDESTLSRWGHGERAASFANRARRRRSRSAVTVSSSRLQPKEASRRSSSSPRGGKSREWRLEEL